MATGGMTKAQGRRQKKLAPYYKLQFGKTDSNKKRKLRRHIRNHPLDVQAKQRFEKDMGRADTHGMSPRGAKRFARADKRQRAAA